MPAIDLVVLVADADTEQVIRGILPRHQALQIRPISFQVYREPGRDSGCRVGAVPLLRQFLGKSLHAMVVFDHEGSGAEQISPAELEQKMESDLSSNGWKTDEAKVMVIAPEVENWVWGSFPHLERVCNWSSRLDRLSDWLIERGDMTLGARKPQRPKEALAKVLSTTRMPPSPSLFRRLADRVSLQNCEDRAFCKFIDTLRNWFPLQ